MKPQNPPSVTICQYYGRTIPQNQTLNIFVQFTFRQKYEIWKRKFFVSKLNFKAKCA